MPRQSSHASWRDSWPPTQVYLHPSDAGLLSVDDAQDLPSIDQEPLCFATAPPSAADDDVMEFDAGIEDARRPRDIVRSVSPSNLESGLGRALRTVSRSPPPRLSASPSPSPLASPHGETADWMHRQADNATAQWYPSSAAARGLLAPATLTVPPSQARPAATRGRARTSRHSPHVWREPSPDVWSITEEDQDADRAQEATAEDLAQDRSRQDTKGRDRVKPKKKVRFALPTRE